MRTAWVVAAGALLLGGCAAGLDKGVEAAGTASGPPSGADMAAYVDCLSEHGVQMPAGGPGTGADGERPTGEPPTDAPTGMPADRPSGAPTERPSDRPEGARAGATAPPPGVDGQAWQAASDACASLAPSERPAGPAGQDGVQPFSTTATGQYDVFWTCMADHDVDAPESRLPADLDEDDATVSAALGTCDVLLPDGPTD